MVVKSLQDCSDAINEAQKKIQETLTELKNDKLSEDEKTKLENIIIQQNRIIEKQRELLKENLKKELG
jgi:Na+/phosphate symporter